MAKNQSILFPPPTQTNKDIWTHDEHTQIQTKDIRTQRCVKICRITYNKQKNKSIYTHIHKHTLRVPKINLNTSTKLLHRKEGNLIKQTQKRIHAQKRT